MEPKTRILFVCLGNICRSPAADGIMHDLVEKRGIADRFTIDSAGTYEATGANCPIRACGARLHAAAIR